jgi:branched-chain amino acid transport system ATP-binding protein
VSGRGAALHVSGLQVAYGHGAQALRGVDLDVGPGEMVALLGPNGAGKTTLLRAVSGMLGLHRGRITGGAATLDGRPVLGADPASLVRRGVSQVMEGRRLFAPLTVEENLRAGAFTVRDKAVARASYDRVMSLFPVLAGRRRAPAGSLSGGEQQMVAIARALMASPRLLLLDEPTVGLAPRVVDEVAAALTAVNAEGTSVLLVEQRVDMALALAGRAVVLHRGEVAPDLEHSATGA